MVLAQRMADTVGGDRQQHSLRKPLTAALRRASLSGLNDQTFLQSPRREPEMFAQQKLSTLFTQADLLSGHVLRSPQGRDVWGGRILKELVGRVPLRRERAWLSWTWLEGEWTKRTSETP